MVLLTNFPNGISSFGIPLLGSGGIPTTTGNYYFVHSGTGASTNDGLSPTAPLATIDQAVNKTTASQGDVVIVMPGHAENITAATSLVLDVAGIYVIGLGYGDNRPKLTFTNTAGRIPISAANVVVDNIVMVGGVADIVSGVTITANFVHLRNIEMRSGSAILEFLQFIDVDAADYVRLENVRILASTTAGTNTGIRIDDTDHLYIVGCELRGDFTTGAISGTAGSAAASTNTRISHCTVENLDTTAGLTIDNHDNTTGICEYNSLITDFDTAPETAFDPGNARCNENYVVNDVDETGAVCPTTAST